jgi:hypothetical protein
MPNYMAAEVSHMWLEILLWQFPETQDYSHHQLPRDDRGFLTYVTSQVNRRPKETTSNAFLVVKFKEGPEDDAVEWDPEIWDPEIARLTKTLSAPAFTAGYGWLSYGVVAVGKSVRFYEFDQKTRIPIAEAWVPQAPEILPYCLKRDSRQIQLTLNWIKQQYPEKVY